MGNKHSETTFNNIKVSYSAVLEVIHSFDKEFPNTAEYDNWMEKELYKYALVYAGKYEINPITDLRPVCPNCHAMLHRKSPPYSIEEIASFRAKLQNNK